MHKKYEELTIRINDIASQLDDVLSLYLTLAKDLHQESYGASKHADSYNARRGEYQQAAPKLRTLLNSLVARAAHNPLSGPKAPIRYL